MPLDTAAAVSRLMRFLAVEGVTGQEAAIGREIAAALKEAGVPASAIYLDDANTRIPVPTETGNLIVAPARPRHAAQPAAAHVHDPHGHRAAVRRREAEDQGPQDRQHREDRARRRQPHRLRRAGHARGRACASRSSTIRRSRCCSACARRAGCGARATSTRPSSARPVMAFNYDGGSASNVVVGAVGADRWEVEIFGRASHAGGAPERGISVDHDPRAGARRGEGRRLVRQGREGQEAGHQQCRAGDRRRRPAGRRCHQCGDRLRACARRKPQPRSEVLQGRSPPPTRPRSRRPRRR